ncbi:unnamed protein product [Ranitomeya imitator]|uniref:Uncharacterized protein n=1 Tax=Ranitomeya imitator TaxID=111125 RepID=A0ABN9L2R1_9NEOB|nr:unnamed protein product [Ranitomeya imitator]
MHISDFWELVMKLEESFPSQPLSDDKIGLNSLLRTILHSRNSRSSFQFQPQRFGRDEHSSMPGDSRIHSRGWDSAPQFWSMAVPQRFGRRNNLCINQHCPSSDPAPVALHFHIVKESAQRHVHQYRTQLSSSLL